MGEKPDTKKLTPKQEKFCQLIASGMNQTDAYRDAYDTARWKPATIHREAKKMMDTPKIFARIAELGAPAIEKVNITIEGVLTDLQRLAEKTEQAEKYGEAIKATELLGKYLKMFTDKTQHSGDMNLNIRWAE
jgi:phage terminase small subunit